MRPDRGKGSAERRFEQSVDGAAVVSDRSDKRLRLAETAVVLEGERPVAVPLVSEGGDMRPDRGKGSAGRRFK